MKREEIIKRIADELNDGGEVNHVKRQLRQEARSMRLAIVLPLPGNDCLVVLPSGRFLLGSIDDGRTF